MIAAPRGIARGQRVDFVADCRRSSLGRLARSLAFPTASVRSPNLWATVRALRRMPARCSPVPGRDPRHDYRTKTFSCCRCGTDGALSASRNTETGMTDYQLELVEGPQRHAASPGPWRPTHRAAHRLSLGEGSYSRTAHFFCGAFALGPSPPRALLALRAGAAALKPTSRKSLK